MTFELDDEYYNIASERIKESEKQRKLIWYIIKEDLFSEKMVKNGLGAIM